MIPTDQLDEVLTALSLVLAAIVPLLVILAKGYVDKQLKVLDAANAARLRGLNATLSEVHHEVKPNSGATMADTATRSEAKLDSLIAGQTDLRDGLRSLDRRVHELREDVGRNDDRAADLARRVGNLEARR